MLLINTGSQMPERVLAIWTATHDNGWTTTAAENADGTYSAWAAPADWSVVLRDYLEDSPEHARIAAEYALKQKTGHECSEQCSGWTYHEHAIESDEG